MRGIDVLYALRDAELDSRTLGIPARTVGKRLGKRDGRAVTGRLTRLEQAGLVRRLDPLLPRWATTDRGREVERLCSSADASRGGRFRPRNEVIHELTERLALAL